MARKKWDRRRVKAPAKFCPPKWMARHFREIGFVDQKGQPKDQVIAGLGTKLRL